MGRRWKPSFFTVVVQDSIVLGQERILDHNLNGKQMWENGERGRDDGREGFSEMFVGDFEILLKPLVRADDGVWRNKHPQLLTSPPLPLLTQHSHGLIVSTFLMRC